MYDRLQNWNSEKDKDLLQTHGMLMSGLIDNPGRYRHHSVGVMSGKRVVHMAPSAKRVPVLMRSLFQWLKNTETHPLIKLSTDKADSAPFIEFMLHRVMESLTRVTPQVKKLLEVAQEEMAALEIQGKLNLKDRKSFRLHYLDPAMRAGVIEMTIPERPNSRLQKYRLTELGRMVTQK
ncbi:Fic family protein [Caedibacter taeniospiralis]|uniref:Fic family protein n=1 Tax=Caedibacter taeniospiralis TaxID=28907 RepID=UPI0013022103|nr:Fic family protein [Caedibacter taeniospiralis]